MSAMGWGLIEAEPEVAGWLDSLTDDEFGQVERYIDLFAEQGVHLTEPFTRQLDGTLREPRLHLDRQQARISYYSPPEASSCSSPYSPRPNRKSEPRSIELDEQ
jgi:hypothetical protein